MNKLIKILAASFGGGVLLGAGLRIGEAVGGPRPAPSKNRDLPPAGELRTLISQSVSEQLAAEGDRIVERVMDHVDARLDSRIAASIVPRIASVEDAVARHSVDMSELRDCSLRTERSLQTLLNSLDRFISSGPTGRASSPEGNGPGNNPEATGEASTASREALIS